MRIIDRSLRPNMSLLKEALRSEAGVVDVSTSYLLPHRITDFTRPDWFCEDPQTCQPIFYNMVDYDFADLYNIEIVEGRNFSRDYPSDINGAFLVNETAVKMAGWDNPLGMEITHYDGRKGTIVGVVKDFNFESMHTEIAPLYMMLDENVSSCLSIRIDKDDLPGTIERIRTIFNRFSPDTPLNYTFFDEEFDQVYHQERRISSLFVFFSMLAIILGCLGMFGMAAFSISQMRKEMGVRKVFGATNRESIILVAKSFMTPVILANIIAWPLSWLILKKWLESFVYRTSISPASFLVAALAVIAITLFTISLNSRRIALQTPADTLRTE
ncbi:MAG: FtsX-like permease family protein [Bacteroidales bacterium]